MLADMSYTCYSGEWLLWAGVAAASMLLYVIGIPLTLVALLRCGQRKGTLQYPDVCFEDNDDINPSDVEASVRRINEFFRNRVAYGSLYQQYEPRFWWFEFGCTMRKMILTGALVLFGAGTTPQVVTALAVCILWFGLVANLNPFEEDADDRLAQTEAIQILFTLLIGLVLQLQATSEPSAVGSSDNDVLGVILVALNCIVVLLALVQQPVVAKVASKIMRCAVCVKRRINATREWESAWITIPSDSEYRDDTLVHDCWVDTSTTPPHELDERPLALVVDSKGDVWIDGHGSAVADPIRAVVDGGYPIWLDRGPPSRLLATPPTRLGAALSFTAATHWLNVSSQRLLTKMPRRLIFVEPTGGTPQRVWRHRQSGTLSVVDPVLITAKSGMTTSATDEHQHAVEAIDLSVEMLKMEGVSSGVPPNTFDSAKSFRARTEYGPETLRAAQALHSGWRRKSLRTVEEVKYGDGCEQDTNGAARPEATLLKPFRAAEEAEREAAMHVQRKPAEWRRPRGLNVDGAARPEANTVNPLRTSEEAERGGAINGQRGGAERRRPHGRNADGAARPEANTVNPLRAAKATERGRAITTARSERAERRRVRLQSADADRALAARKRLAAKLHDQWREDRLESDGTYLPRMKMVDGVQYDIANLDFELLPPQLQESNMSAAHAACTSVEHACIEGMDLASSDCLEWASARQHANWMEHNKAWADADLLVEYDVLSEVEKEKDRAFVRAALQTYAEFANEINASLSPEDRGDQTASELMHYLICHVEMMRGEGTVQPSTSVVELRGKSIVRSMRSRNM